MYVYVYERTYFGSIGFLACPQSLKKKTFEKINKFLYGSLKIKI